MVRSLSSTVNYTYDIANRLAVANGVVYTYDANGNLLDDGANTYAYDSANRLTSVNGTGSYTYNGLGDRLSQNGINYTLDLNTGLTQVLSDGTTTYTYGLGRISQTVTPDTGTPDTEYFLGDALGSVRQLTSQTGAVTYAASYSPYGEVSQAGGAGQSAYGYTGEQQSGDLVYLRARYLNVNDGRFLSKDTWKGNYNSPLSLNKWMYTVGNPINLTDPTGNFPEECRYMPTRRLYEDCVRRYYGLSVPSGLDGNVMPGSEENSIEVPKYDYGSSGCWEGPVAYTAPGILLGTTFGGSALVSVSVGSEEVFDFANMTSQRFNVLTYGLTGTASITITGYYGAILGLNNTNTTAEVYKGESHFVSVGAGAGEVLTVAAGWTISHSTENPDLWTMSQYYSGGGGVDIIPVLDVSFGVSNAEFVGGPRELDMGSLLMGNFYNLSFFKRYADIHEEIYANSR